MGSLWFEHVSIICVRARRESDSSVFANKLQDLLRKDDLVQVVKSPYKPRLSPRFKGVTYVIRTLVTNGLWNVAVFYTTNHGTVQRGWQVESIGASWHDRSKLPRSAWKKLPLPSLGSDYRQRPCCLHSPMCLYLRSRGLIWGEKFWKGIRSLFEDGRIR